MGKVEKRHDGGADWSNITELRRYADGRQGGNLGVKCRKKKYPASTNEMRRRPAAMQASRWSSPLNAWNRSDQRVRCKNAEVVDVATAIWSTAPTPSSLSAESAMEPISGSRSRAGHEPISPRKWKATPAICRVEMHLCLEARADERRRHRRRGAANGRAKTLDCRRRMRVLVFVKARPACASPASSRAVRSSRFRRSSRRRPEVIGDTKASSTSSTKMRATRKTT